MAVDIARRAANAKKLIVFSPPIAVLDDGAGERAWQARQIDLLLGLALSVECDQNPQVAREKLEQLLGPATVVVASGGEWINPETGEVLAKLHLHWRLREPAEQTELDDLKSARDIAMRLVGGDPTNVPIVHPIRWPGSWHRKKTPRLCRIVELNDNEIDLETAFDALQNAAPSLPTAGKPNGSTSDNGFAALSSEIIGEPNWDELIGAVITGASYHNPLNRLAAKMVTAGMDDQSAANLLRGLMKASEARRDDRWQTRYDDIDRSVSSALEKYGPQQEQEQEQKPQAKTSSVEPAKTSTVEPVDLWARSRVPPLPRGLMPAVIEEYAFVQGVLMGADPAGLAMGALTICAATITDNIKVQGKRHDRDWLESTRMWTGLCGEVSAKKTPIALKVIKPIERIDNALWRTYLAAKEHYDNLPPDERKKAQKPTSRRVKIEDVTSEATQDILVNSPDGVLLFCDELSGWFGMMDKYGGNKGARADRGFWLKAFNGAPASFDRVGRGSARIEHLSINVLGGIQPDTARGVMADGIDDGLIQRINPIMLQDGTTGTDEPTAPVVERYDELIERLHQTSKNFLHDIVQLNDDAQKVRQQVEQMYQDLAVGYKIINKKLAGHIGKYHGMFIRFCLLWHIIEHHEDRWPTNIDGETAARVAKFMHEFLLPHASAFYNDMLGLADNHDQLTDIAGYILAHKVERLTNRDFARGDRTMRKLDRKDIERVFDQLDTLGWISRTPGRKFNDPLQGKVNPQVHIKFKDFAEKERVRRESLRARIIEINNGGEE